MQQPRPIDVIVPVYRGLRATRRALDSLLASRGAAPFDVIVVDDASPEPALSEWLRELAARTAITLIVHVQNRGFVHSVNEGMAAHPDRDVVLLNSDTEVAPGWLDRMAACAARDARIATVTPFSNNATICSYPHFAEPNALPQGVTAAELDRVFAAVNAGRGIDIPTAVGFCMFISRACLDTVGAFDESAFGLGYGEEVDFCMRATRAGWRHAHCADVFVFHEGEVSFGNTGTDRRTAAQKLVDERYPEFPVLVSEFVARDPAKPLRDRVTARLRAEDGEARVTAMMIVGADAFAGLRASIPGMTGNTVLPGMHFCFLVPVTLAPDAQGELDRLAHLLDGRWPWSIEPVDANVAFAEALRGVAGKFPGEDIVLLEPGVELPYAWDARLRKAAHAEAGIGAALPMCDVAPLYELLAAKTRADSHPDAALVDRAAYCLGDRVFYEVAGLHGVCAWLRRDALDAALPSLQAGTKDAQPLLDALERRLRSGGRMSVICDYLYVGFAGKAPAQSAARDDFEAQAYLQHHPLGVVRRAVNEAVRQGLPHVSVPGLDHRPVQLHITHFWGGGLERWVQDFAAADPSRINMILATYRIGESGGQRIVLYSDPAALIPIRTWDIARPIRSTVPASIEYRRILEQVLAEFDVDAFFISSLIGHSLEALDLPRKTVVVCHDFYPICQAINPQFGKTCERCTLEDLRECAKSNPLNSIFVDQTSDEWHEMRGRYVEQVLARRIEMVAPSPSVMATLRRLEPRLANHPIHLIPHGIDLDAPKLPYPSRAPGERLRIVVLGRMSMHKGSELLRAAREGLHAYADVTLVGGGKNGAKLAEACGWKSIERYERDGLPALLKSLAPHAGLLASVIPETFSYTLSELNALGVPAIATALGSFNDRIVDEESGFLFTPDKDALVALVRMLSAQPGRLEKVAANLASRSPGRSTTEMAADYAALVPLAARPIARFRVGIGMQTGLTEPYRHLTEAYAQLSGAYGESTKAYEHTRAAFEQANGELGNLKDLWAQWGAQVGALQLRTRWWNAPKALRLFLELREKMRLLK